jgi:hypothetical protein
MVTCVNVVKRKRAIYHSYIKSRDSLAPSVSLRLSLLAEVVFIDYR